MENNSPPTGGLKSIRTFQTDTQEIEKKGIPLADLVAEAQKRGSLVAADTTQKLSGKKIAIILVGLVIIAGISLGAFLFFNSRQQENQPVELGPKPILISDQQVEAKNNLASIQSALQTPISVNNILYISITASPQEFLTAINANPPQEFVDALNNRFMLAKFYLTKDWPILIFKIDSYESAFAGMLKWEKSIGKDLEGIFNSGNGGDFSDKETQNHDTRSSPVLIYSFVNQDYLVIVQNEEPLKEVFHRFSSPQYLNE